MSQKSGQSHINFLKIKHSIFDSRICVKSFLNITTNYFLLSTFRKLNVRVPPVLALPKVYTTEVA